MPGFPKLITVVTLKKENRGESTILILSQNQKNETHPKSAKARKPQSEKTRLESVVCPLLNEAGLWVKVASYFPLMDYRGSEQISIYGYFGKVLHVQLIDHEQGDCY